MPPRSSIPMGNLALPPFTRGVKWLLIASLAISIAGLYLPGFKAAVEFSPADLWYRGWVWQPFTYTLLQTSVDGIIFAALGLWLLGGSLEAMWGTRRFVTFYFATSVVAALATAFVGLVFRDVGQTFYAGTGPILNALAAAFAVLLPTATIFLVILPLPARLLLPISAGITLLLMVFERRVAPYLPHAFALGAGVLFAGGVRTPRQLWLRVRVWWIDKRLRSRKLRVVRGDDDTPGSGRSGSDKYLH